MEILKDELMVEILSSVHKTMLPYYAYYANNKGLLNCDGFSKFCHDFGIFPDILSKAKIMRFFHTLSNFYQSTNIQSESAARVNSSSQMGLSSGDASSSKDVIDEHLFVEALALTAFEVPYREP